MPETSMVHVGTSGWSYDGWRGVFFPEGLPKRKWLSWYAGRFGTTEINGSFYRTPPLGAVSAWREQTPDDFVFAWKASRFITHWKRLSPRTADSLALMETRLAALGPKAGPVLFQLPARFGVDHERLQTFLDLLTPGRPYVLEVRDASWFDDAVYELLRKYDVALCLSDHRDARTPWEITARHVYVRGHGPQGDYRDRYPETTLREWADHIRTWQQQMRTVYVYFDNDQKSAAPHDAQRLKEILAET